MTTPSDHPPAIPPIGVRQAVYMPPPNEWGSSTITANIYPWGITVPLGLSPEQPARLGGEAMP